MQLLYLLTDAFINTFGITQPVPAARRRASFFILALLILLLLGVATAGIVIYKSLH